MVLSLLLLKFLEIVCELEIQFLQHSPHRILLSDVEQFLLDPSQFLLDLLVKLIDRKLNIIVIPVRYRLNL